MNAVIGSMDAPVVAAMPKERRGPSHWLRISVAAVIGALSLLPLHRLLDAPDTGIAGQATVAMTSAFASVMWASLVILLIPVIVVTRAVPVERADRALAALARTMARPTPLAFAGALGAFAFVAAAVFGEWVLDGQPNLVDAMSQLTHARFVAAGQLAGPGPENGAFWSMQQSLFTARGWVSQYPPGHVILLAAGLAIHAVWAVGPAMLALTVLFTALAAERLLPGRTAVARTGALLVALSPFLIAHAGAFMSHTTAAAFGAIAIWCAARSDDGTPWWMAGAGVAIGAMFATRPVSALTLAAGISFWSALRAARTDQLALRRSAGRIALFAAGALPFVALVALYNSHFFGSATTFGYNAALGQAAGLGFGTDPWGNTYGPLQALAYTSAELSALNLFLLETPLPAVAIVALYLVLAPRLARGETLIAAWALLPVAAQLPYWHHGLFMGPRMLNESAPAWALLAAIAVVALVARLPARLPASPGWSPRTFGATLALGAVLAGVFVLGPMRLSSYTQRPLAFDAASSAQAPALIFVHGGWTSRLAMRLAAAGMRLDSVETALRQNPTCAVQTYADARRAGSPLPALDFAPRATALPQAVELSPGNRIRIAAGETRLAGECGRQAAADRNGVIDVTPLLWRGDLPGAPVSGAMFVRDMGPPDNETIIAAEPARTAYILMTAAPDAPPRLLPYAEGVRLLWGANREGA